MAPTRSLLALAGPLWLVAVALAGAAGAGVEVEPLPPPGTLALTHVAVLPMDAERLLADQTVVIRDGVIAAIGPAELVAVPADATAIDARGKVLLPGLVDAHVHLREEEATAHLFLYVAHGVTTVQCMSGSPWHLELRQRTAAGELLGPRILTTGPTTARERVASPARAEQVVAEQKAAGYDAIKMYGDGSNSMTRETYARLIAAAHAAGLRVVGHAPRNHPFSVVLEEGQDSIDHLEEIVYTYPAITDALGPLLDVQFGRRPPSAAEEALAATAGLRDRLSDDLDRLAREVRAAGLAVTPTLAAFRTIWRQTGSRYPELLLAPEMRTMHPVTRVEWGPELNGYRSAWADRLEVVERILGIGVDLQMAMIRPLQDAGVRLLSGTDAPLELVFPGRSLHDELALLVEAGLTPYQALTAATSAPAAELGLDAEAGTVAAGKRADLLLLDANPLDDIAHTRRIAGVVLAGRWLSAAGREERLAAIASEYDALEARVAPLLEGFRAGDPEPIGAALRRQGERAPAVAALAERLINELGYRYLDEELDRALAAFRLNTELFPERANPWDSLGEALLHAERFAESLASYRKALELDPDSANAAQYVGWIEDIAARRGRQVDLAPEELGRYVGDYGERHVRRGEGALLYHRGEGRPQPLVALGDHTFMIEGVGWFALRFELDGEGRAVKIVGSYADGRTDESPRDERSNE